jgi:hypothetical protein
MKTPPTPRLILLAAFWPWVFLTSCQPLAPTPPPTDSPGELAAKEAKDAQSGAGETDDGHGQASDAVDEAAVSAPDEALPEGEAGDGEGEGESSFDAGTASESEDSVDNAQNEGADAGAWENPTMPSGEDAGVSLEAGVTTDAGVPDETDEPMDEGPGEDGLAEVEDALEEGFESLVDAILDALGGGGQASEAADGGAGEGPQDAGSDGDDSGFAATDAGADHAWGDAGYDSPSEPDAGAPPVPTDLPIESCFDPQLNDNLEGIASFAGDSAMGGTVCNAQGALNLGDNAWAGLAFSGDEGGTLQGQSISSCLVVDLGKRCALNDHIGISIAHRLAGEVCGDSASSNQCAVGAVCGSMPGSNLHLFVADALDDIRFAMSTTSCGNSPSWISSGSPVTSLANTADLAAVRYLIACRPFEGCDADAANVEIDAFFLTHRL